MRRFLSDHWLRLLVHAAALQPLASMIYAWLTDNLTVNPIQDLTLRTGKAALVMLVASLSVSPLGAWFGFRRLVPHRRTLGLYAFFYASLHLAMFALVDFGLNWGLIWKAVLEKRFVVAGFSAFLILLALAVTSTKGWQRRMGKRWKQLHRLVYVAALLVIVHYVWLVKSDIRIPLAYGALVAFLLILRLPPVRRLGANWAVNLRKSFVKPAAPGK